jgi:hypothetical protein
MIRRFVVSSDQGESRTPTPPGHDVLSVACLPVPPLGRLTAPLPRPGEPPASAGGWFRTRRLSRNPLLLRDFQRPVRESNPPLRLEGPPSYANRRTGRVVADRIQCVGQESNLHCPAGGWVTATWARQCPADACLFSFWEGEARPPPSGTSGSRTHTPRRFELRRFADLRTVPGLDFLEASSMGFEPTISTVTGWRGRPTPLRRPALPACASGRQAKHPQAYSCDPPSLNNSNLKVIPDGLEPSLPGCRPGVVAAGPRDLLF